MLNMDEARKSIKAEEEEEPDRESRDWAGSTKLTQGEWDACNRVRMSQQCTEQCHKAVVDLEEEGEAQPQKVCNTEEMRVLWTGCQTLDEMKTALQARMTRIMGDLAMCDKVKAVMAERLWCTMDLVDRKGVILDGQIDPNNTISMHDGEARATCAACNASALLSNNAFWSEGAKQKLKNRLEDPAPRVRSGLMCINCGKPKPKPLVCSSCERKCVEEDFTKAQRSKKKMRCTRCVEGVAVNVASDPYSADCVLCAVPAGQ